MSIEIVNESGYPGINEEMLISVASYALGQMDIHPDAETTISLVDNDTMSHLHVQWMGLEGPTDVMSFPMDEITPGHGANGRPDTPPVGPSMLGDIILCPEFARRQADMAGHDLGHELALLTVHGVLHLLGYDHQQPAEEREMFALQNEILANWYDYLAAEGTTFQPKPTGRHAFPSAADRAELDKLVPGGGIPVIAEPSDDSEDTEDTEYPADAAENQEN
ncbi:putative metalloprotease [Corynebacterium renale]|uniref:rRNA maturation RNase YbeY n=1 Tax=Corynebacterium renale TaxID=1724 RepID=UPI000DA27033|nr:rRNA maturation RNase YbeY [Corynebacterium renale]SQG65115.1 putative metalloprotease [Corynebacterium renale]STC97928.1 putative metalloprotease [Corynebacterium renale]